MFACQQAKVMTTAANDTKANNIPGDGGGCCLHCPHKSMPPSSGPTDKPSRAEKPSVPSHSVCSCADRHALPPATSSIEQMDVGLVLFLPPPANVFPGVGIHTAVVGMDIPPPTPRLHVLNCAWLC